MKPTSITPPTLSIVTPSFNQASYLEATMSSVIGQHYPGLEYVVVDGQLPVYGTGYAVFDGTGVINTASTNLPLWMAMAASPGNARPVAMRSAFRADAGTMQSVQMWASRPQASTSPDAFGLLSL